MPGARIEWHGDAVQQQVAKRVAKRIATAAQLVANQVKRNISTSWPPPSVPGEMPHLRTGQLRNSIFWRPDGTESAIVGTAALHGLFLEEGTSLMEARPFLVATLDEMRDQIEQVISGGGGA